MLAGLGSFCNTFDSRSIACHRELGLVFASGRPSREEGRTLREMKVMPGDYLDVTVQVAPDRGSGAGAAEAR